MNRDLTGPRTRRAPAVRPAGPNIPGRRALALAGVAALLLFPALVSAQDRLKSMPGYKQYARMKDEIGKSVKLGGIGVTWTNDGRAFVYRQENKTYLYDIATAKTVELPPPPPPPSPPTNAPATNPASTNPPSTDRNRAGQRSTSRPRREHPERGRQYTNAVAPNGALRAFHRDRNLWLSHTNGSNEIAVTTEGSDRNRIKFGTANWVYGEELFQSTAIWWASNSQKVAFYRFDESSVLDYPLALQQTKIQSSLLVEPYMKAGASNPVVDLLVYDVASRQTVRIDVRDGRPFDNAVVGHYVYGVSWSADSRELLFRRTNRRQNIMELCAAHPDTGRCRVIVREEWPASWTENSPTFRFLKDGQRFIWASERTGWRNFYLYHLDGRLLATLTRHPFEVEAIEHIDETGGVLFYTARSGDNPMKLQLHRVRLDGGGEQRLTNPAYDHSVDIAPDARHFIDILQTHDTPPVTRLMATDGRTISELARSDPSRFNQLGLKRVELFRFKAADGTNDLFGMLHFPSTFKPSKRYPLLVNVYAGPATTGARESFTLPSALTELGFLVASFDSRGASGRGKRFLDTLYQRLGTIEIDDQAAGVKFLRQRRYVDGRRVGIQGTSYGGFAAAMALLRYPDVFQAACANSAVTDFRNYDSIYTERYMWIPQENKAGYEGTSAMRLAANLKGRLMIFYGTADDNVHPSNALQLIEALQKAGKSFEVQVGPDLGHTAVHRERMMEFFIGELASQ